MMKYGNTLILLVSILAVGFIVCALSIIGIPQMMGNAFGGTSVGYAYISFGIGLYVTMIPFYYSLYQAIKLLKNIDRNNTFVDSSVRALNRIKVSAGVIFILYIIMFPFIYLIAQDMVVGPDDDGPVVIILGIFVILTTFFITAFAGLLQKFFQEVIDMKEENE